MAPNRIRNRRAIAAGHFGRRDGLPRRMQAFGGAAGMPLIAAILSVGTQASAQTAGTSADSVGTVLPRTVTPQAIVDRGKARFSVVPPSCTAVMANRRAGETLVCARRAKDIPRLPLPGERYAVGEVVHHPGEVPISQYAEDRIVGSCSVQRGKSCAGTVSLVGDDAPWVFRALGHLLAPNAIPGPAPRAETGSVLVTLPSQGQSRGIAIGPDPSPGKP